MVNGLLSVIPAELRQSPLFKHLVEAAARSSEGFPALKKHCINIVGASDSGKSSLINCLLGLLDLAKSVSAGQACTHVPTSYEGGLPGQTETFAAKIEFFTTQEIRTKIEIWLNDYYEWTHSDERRSKGERDEVKAAALSALGALHSLFCERHDFSSEQAAKASLARIYSNERTKVVDDLLAWCVELLSKENQRGSFQEFSKQDDLTSYIQKFAFSNVKKRKTGLWPLVKKIKQGLRGIPILDYVTLTDWQGSDDTNRIRGQASAERIYDCDEIWIVSAMKRISSDPVLKENLVRCSDDFPCTVICTCIESNLDDSLAKEMEEAGEPMGEYEDCCHQQTQLERDIEKCRARLADRKQLEKGTSILRGSKKFKVDEETRALMLGQVNEIKLAKLGLDEELRTVQGNRCNLLVDIRKNYIDKLVQQEVFERLGHSRFRLFCVSNKDYKHHKRGRLE